MSQQQTITSIQDLQNMEQKLQSGFDSLSPDQKSATLMKMQELTQMRVNLFNLLKEDYTRDAQESTSELQNQVATLRIVEENLAAAKNDLRTLEDQRNNKMRMVEISTYFSEKYKAYNELFKLIIYMSIPVILLIVVGNMNLIPEKYVSRENSHNFFLILIVLVGLYGLFQILNKTYDIVSRDNMNFNEYDFDLDFDLDKAAAQNNFLDNSGGNGVLGYDTKEFEKLAEDMHLGCVDSYCCADGTMYDSLKKQCIPVMKAHMQQNSDASLTKGTMSNGAGETNSNGANTTTAEAFSSDIVPFASF